MQEPLSNTYIIMLLIPTLKEHEPSKPILPIAYAPQGNLWEKHQMDHGIVSPPIVRRIHLHRVL